MLAFSTHRIVFHLIDDHKKASEHTCEFISEYFTQKRHRIIHIYSDAWENRRDIIESRVRALFGLAEVIYAKETICKRISKPIANAFLEANHLHVPTNTKYKYGLFHYLELVAVATFSAKRKMTRNGVPVNSYELIRFCSLKDIAVMGGLSKIIHYFTQDVHPQEIMTYADRDWSVGDSYVKLGFEKVQVMPPTAYILDLETKTRLHESRYLALPEKQKPKKTIKFYNAGSIKFIKKT